MPADLTGKNYFGFTGHEHHFGTGVTVGMGTKGAAMKPVYDVGAAFSWSEPPTVYHDPPVVLEAGGGFQLKCTWDNTGPTKLKFGESAQDEMCFFKPGDVVKWKPVTRDEYDAAIEAVEANRYEPVIRPATFSLTEFNKDMAGTNAKLMEALNGH